MNEKSEFLEKINNEIENRIEIMESSSYESVSKFTKNDVIISVIIMILCAVILVYTYNFLC